VFGVVVEVDCRLALQLQTEFDEERGGSREVVDNDADVVHPLDRHVLKRWESGGFQAWRLIGAA
jgi:hypothetical protein